LFIGWGGDRALFQYIFIFEGGGRRSLAEINVFEQCEREQSGSPPDEWLGIAAIIFPALPDPQPQLCLPPPLHPQPPPAPVAPVGKLQRGGGGCSA